VLANFASTARAAMLGIHLFDTPVAAVTGRVGESDILRGEAGAQILHGEAVQTPTQAFAQGVDTRPAAACAATSWTAAQGDDIALGGVANDVLLGGAGHDLLIGGAGDDALSGDQYLDSEPEASAGAWAWRPSFLRSPDVAVAAGRDECARRRRPVRRRRPRPARPAWAATTTWTAAATTTSSGPAPATTSPSAAAGSDVIGGADGNDALHGDGHGPARRGRRQRARAAT
jgi:Ca2+-binding RTX toxin-like protein